MKAYSYASKQLLLPVSAFMVQRGCAAIQGHGPNCDIAALPAPPRRQRRSRMFSMSRSCWKACRKGPNKQQQQQQHKHRPRQVGVGTSNDMEPSFAQLHIKAAIPLADPQSACWCTCHYLLGRWHNRQPHECVPDTLHTSCTPETRLTCMTFSLFLYLLMLRTSARSSSTAACTSGSWKVVEVAWLPK